MAQTPEERRRVIRESTARHKARMDELTRLEQAAWYQRGLFGDGTPYLPAELKEAEALRAMTDELTRRAEALHGTVLHRLKREAATSEGKTALLERFEAMKDTRITIKPF